MSTMTQDFLAEPGEKVTDIPIIIRYAKFNRAISWNRSNTMFIIAKTPDGQTIKISGSSQSLFGLQRGDEVTIASAKVKGHGEYQGTPQTILWHVKIQEGD